MRKRVVWMLLAWAVSGNQVYAESAADLTLLPLEQLMDVKVYAASKYEQSQQDAPASVTVVTAADIHSYGWRNLGDLLRAQRGMYLSYDRIYGYLGIRGVLISGDLNSRVLVTVDGHRISDVVYEQAFILNDFILDAGLIERVELVRGAGSSLHGGTPLFGVINIVTRNAAGLPGHQLKMAVGSDNAGELHYSLGQQFAHGGQLVLSLSGMRTDGPALHFNEPGRFTGKTSETDFERVGRFFAKYQYQDWKLLLAHSRRNKGIATGATGAVFDHSDNHYVDTQSALNLSHVWRLDTQHHLEGRVYAGRYDFYGQLLYPDNRALVVNKDLAQAVWHGSEWKLTADYAAHHWVAGIEYQRNRRQDQQNYDVGGEMFLDAPRSSRRYAAYLQHQWQYADKTAFTWGLRYDKDYLSRDEFSPRLAWIYRPQADKTLKLLASHAFRSPNVAEAFYSFGERFAPNLSLKSETIDTLEAVYEHSLTARTHYTINLYSSYLNQRINQLTLADGRVQYQNYGHARIMGGEFELTHEFSALRRLRTSLSLQQGEDESGAELTDSPGYIFTLNYRQPIMAEQLQLGTEVQHIARRETFSGQHTAPYTLVNANVYGALPGTAVRWSIGVYNLMAEHYATPDTPDPASSRDRIEQDGRQWRVTLAIPLEG